MLPHQLFRYCPSCGSRVDSKAPGKLFTCQTCDFHYYFNPTVAAAAIVLDNSGRVLCFRRAREPQQGKLAFPGGFIDYGETAETGLRREIREEVGLEVGTLEFLCSASNHYTWKGVTYSVVDLVFHTRAKEVAVVPAGEEVMHVTWIKPADVPLDELAFPSLRLGLQILLARTRQP